MYIKDGTGMGYIYRNGEQDISNFVFKSLGLEKYMFVA
jgi:hypothetical protein